MKDTGISLPYFNCPLPMMGSKGQFNQRMVMMTLTTRLQAEGSCHGRNHITDFCRIKKDMRSCTIGK